MGAFFFRVCAISVAASAVAARALPPGVSEDSVCVVARVEGQKLVISDHTKIIPGTMIPVYDGQTEDDSKEMLRQLVGGVNYDSKDLKMVIKNTSREFGGNASLTAGNLYCTESLEHPTTFRTTDPSVVSTPAKGFIRKIPGLYRIYFKNTLMSELGESQYNFTKEGDMVTINGGDFHNLRTGGKDLSWTTFSSEM